MTQVRAWRPEDSGLLPLPGPFRRTEGAVHAPRGRAARWPVDVQLERTRDELVVRAGSGDEVGRWPWPDVSLDVLVDGPPVTFVVRLPGEAHLVAAAPGTELDTFLGR